jgi:hypothetical protein
MGGEGARALIVYNLPRLPRQEAESVLNLLKISRFPAPRGGIQPIFGTGSQ